MKLPNDFINKKLWLEAINKRKQIEDKPAVYIIQSSSAFSRLVGESKILYIGSTKRLGGSSESCRLRIYKYPNGKHARQMKSKLEALAHKNLKVTIHWKFLSNEGDAKLYESKLQNEYINQHLELPPFNFRLESLIKIK